MGKEIVNQSSPAHDKPKKEQSKHILIKLKKVKDKHKILKAIKEKRQRTKELPSGYQLISQHKLYKPEGNGMLYLKWWKGRTYNQKYSTQQDSPSDLMEKSKAFHTKQKLREVSTTKPVQFNHSVMSYSLQPHGLQHARLPCPSPTPGACSNSHLWSQWCHPTILSSVVPFSSCLQSFS